ncbi:MAG: CDP-diacylglycerol--glycerol-3-phosphate 3-phosphatidyltransferase [Gemmatimonadetes bacterium]|nr:CDP-diacylglycerol--glycerol-3-phosphate 3-phosphatidyltransferase [Gemmatimonadota bacterium]
MWTLPNLLTIGRIAITPVIAYLPFIEGYWPKLLTFVVFIIAAVSDVIDGRIARRRGLVTDLGKVLDPLADKLLLLATVVPIYVIAQTRRDLYDIPLWRSIPVWVCLVLIGREFAMTAFRWFAKRRGVVIAAHGHGKLKTVTQNIFVGGTILWFAFRDAWNPLALHKSAFWQFWKDFHGHFVSVSLAIATALTVYSFAVYLYRYRRLFD